MSLIVCLRAVDGIILAADSRGTIGDPRGLTAINDTYVKIFSFGKCGMGFAGASEMGAALYDELRKKGIPSQPTFDDIVKQVAQYSAELFERWFGKIIPSERPAVLITLAGYRSPHPRRPESQQAEPMIYLLNSQLNFAPQLCNQSPSLSGVPQYAVYLVHRYYGSTISLAKAKALAEYLIAETASQDPKVGGPIRMAIITPALGYQELPPEEINAIHAANADLNKQLQKFFLE